VTVLVISAVLTVWSAITLWLTTTGSPRMAQLGCVSGLMCQGLWIAFDVLTGAYGLLPLALVFGTLYVRGYRRWGLL
jgi:hypothetical protein